MSDWILPPIALARSALLNLTSLPSTSGMQSANCANACSLASGIGVGEESAETNGKTGFDDIVLLIVEVLFVHDGGEETEEREPVCLVAVQLDPTLLCSVEAGCPFVGVDVKVRSRRDVREAVISDSRSWRLQVTSRTKHD